MYAWLLENWKWTLTTLLAIVAISFTSHRWFLNWREKRKKVKVTLGLTVMTTANGTPLGSGTLSWYPQPRRQVHPA